MRDEILKYYIPKSFIKKEMRYNILVGFVLGVGSAVGLGILIALIFL
jgi:capsular polysaccharide biosynthesis protein